MLRDIHVTLCHILLRDIHVSLCHILYCCETFMFLFATFYCETLLFRFVTFCCETFMFLFVTFCCEAFMSLFATFFARHSCFSLSHLVARHSCFSSLHFDVSVFDVVRLMESKAIKWYSAANSWSNQWPYWTTRHKTLPRVLCKCCIKGNYLYAFMSKHKLYFCNGSIIEKYFLKIFVLWSLFSWHYINCYLFIF